MRRIDRREQQRISSLWADAASQLRDSHPELANQCQRKSNAIANSRDLSSSEVASINQGLDNISDQLSKIFER